jgi:integrase
MKRRRVSVSVPGFKYDARSRTAFFEIIVPKTGGRVRRRKRVTGVRDQSEAIELYSQFRRSVLEPAAGARPDATFQEYVKANWPISRDARRPISSETEAKEWSALQSRILPGLGHLRITEITDVSVEDFSAELLRQGLSNSTVNSRLRITRKVLAHARRRGKIPAPALDSWPCPLEEKELHQEMSPDEVGRFLRAFDTAVIKGAGGVPASLYYTERLRWARPYFVLAIHLGLARGDLKNLRWTNVDLGRNLVQVERAKTGKTATIPLSRAAREAIEQCRNRPIVSAEYVLVTPEGERYSNVTIRRYFLVALKEAGIRRGIRPHDLRHSFGSLLASAGVPLSYVKAAMGHAHERTTQRYARVNRQSLQPIATALDDIN